MSVQPALLGGLNSAFHNRQYTSEGLTDSESIEPEGTAALHLKIIASSSASVICKMSMPVSEVSDILWFKGKNVTDFLKAFDNMCDDHSIGSVKRLKKVCCYCKRHMCEYVCSLVSLEKDN